MAKKKSSKKNIGLIISIVILALGVASFCMAFLTGVNYTAGDTVIGDFTGFQTMFGYMEKGDITGLETHYLAFSIMALLAFALPLIGAVLAFTKNKIVRFVGAGLMIAGAVLLFLLPSFVVFASAEGLSFADATATTAGVGLLKNATAGLGIGAILGGVFAGLGGLVSLYNCVRK